METSRWPELSPAASERVHAALAGGRKIEAIKIYREAANCGLKEAKDAVEREGVQVQKIKTTRPAGPNSLTLFLVMLVLAVVLLALLLFFKVRQIRFAIIGASG